MYEIHKSLERVKVIIRENKKKGENKESIEQLFLKKFEEVK